MSILPNTTCDVYRVGNAPPAAPDVAGVPCFLTNCFDLGRERGEKEAQQFRFTSILRLAPTTDIRDDFNNWGGSATNRDTVYIPDQNGVGYLVNFVERVQRGTPVDHLRAYLDRVAVTWPYPATSGGGGGGGGGGTPPAIVQTANAHTTGGSVSVGWPAPTTAGNLLVYFVMSVSGSVTTPSGCTLLASAAAPPDPAVGVSEGTLFLFVAVNAPSLTSQAFTTGGGGNRAVGIEVANCSTSSPSDQQSTNTGTSTTADTGATPTTSSANEIAFAGFLSGTESSPTNGFTALDFIGGGSDAASPVFVFYKILSATGAVACAITLGTDYGWAAIMGTFE